MKTETYLGFKQNDLYPTNIYDIIIWCRDYDRNNKFPQDTLTRFAIGFYQIHQGIGWGDRGVNKYEGFAAAAIHFFIVAERLGLSNLDASLEIKLTEFPEIDYWGETAKRLLFNLSVAQQQVMYGAKQYKTQRKSRFDKSKAAGALGKVLCDLIGLIPTKLRTQAFNVASMVMTKELK